MRFFSIPFIAFLLFLFSCKRDLIPRRGVLVVDSTMTCYNEALDNNEVGVDCGGNCKPCENIIPICAPENNHLVFNNLKYALTNGTFTHNERAIFKAYFNNGDSYITMNLKVFDPSKTFIMKEYVTDSAFIQIYHTIESSSNFSLATLLGGLLYAHDVDGKRVITICGGRYWSNITRTHYFLDTLKLTIN